jgi:ribosomal protein S14
MNEDQMNETRAKAWKTRRRKYGQCGHASSYSRSPSSCQHCDAMRAVLAKLHNDGILSEGQAARATGLGRIGLRKLADEIANGAR